MATVTLFDSKSLSLGGSAFYDVPLNGGAEIAKVWVDAGAGYDLSTQAILPNGKAAGTATAVTAQSAGQRGHDVTTDAKNAVTLRVTITATAAGTFSAWLAYR
jgi:hypothetical protein